MMRKDGHYLRFAVAAVFLALGAYLIAGFTRSALHPDTVTAQKVTVSETVTADGTILRDELCVCFDGDAGKLSAKSGERLRAGELICSDDKDELRSPCAGFFCSGIDGWESLSPEQLAADPVFPEGAVGRIVRGGWFFVCSPENAAAFYPGQTVTLTLDGAGSFPAVCCSVSGKNVVLKCREGLESVLCLRFAKAELCLCSASGYKLPASAVGKDDDGEFVRVMKAGLIRSVPVTTVYKKDGFCLVQTSAFGEGAEVLR